MFFTTLIPSTIVALAAIAEVRAETHTITFVNNCGTGTPTLISHGAVLSTGGAYTSNGPIIGAVAFLQTGSCGSSGENCCDVDISLNSTQTTCEPTCNGLTGVSGISPKCTVNGANLVVGFCN